MGRRSRFAEPAENWLKKHAPGHAVPFKEFWAGLSLVNPDLTQPSEGRKTPRATCMRDLRMDSVFEVGDGKISLKEEPAS